MLPAIGFTLLFFLPLIESLDRSIGLSLLFLGSVLIGFSLFSRKRIILDFPHILIWMILTVFTVSIFNSWSISRSYTELLRYLAYFLIFIAVYNWEQPQKIITRFYLPMIVVNGLMLSFLALLYFVPATKLPAPTNGMNLFYPVFGHNRIADILIFAIPISIVLFHSVRNKWSKVIFMGLSIFFIGMLIISMGRGAILSLALSFFLYFFLQQAGRKNDKNLPGWALGLGTVAIIFLVSSFFYSNFFIKKEFNWQAIPKFYKPAANDRRIDYLSYAWKSIDTSPFFGTGLDTFRYVSRIYQRQPASWSWYTHNHFLQLFQETGIVGGLLFAILIVITFIRSVKSLTGSKLTDFSAVGIFIGLLASAIHSLIDYDWQYISIFLFVWIGLALLQPKENNVPVVNTKKNFPKIILIIIFSLFLPKLFLVLNSDAILKKADILVQEGRTKEAVFILERAFRLDEAYHEIPQKLAEIYQKTGDADWTEFWSQKTTNLNRLEY